MISTDYQTFELGTRLTNVGERMQKKLDAIDLPDLAGKLVLDVGTDHGFWAWLAAERGAEHVLGLDRNRVVKGCGLVDLVKQNREVAAEKRLPCWFEQIDLGKQWLEFGQFDVVLMMSLYHHVYQNCGDHNAIWYWLWRHTAHDGELIWENPVDSSDAVVRMNMSPEYQGRYTRGRILSAAARYFRINKVGPAKHEPNREVWRCTPLDRLSISTVAATAVSGAGGAAEAFNFAAGRRTREIESILGITPVPGSLNLQTNARFDWDVNYYRAQVLDVRDRSVKFSGWAPRWCRFYPLQIESVSAWAMRFEGEGYPENFVELISDTRLRDVIASEEVVLCL